MLPQKGGKSLLPTIVEVQLQGASAWRPFIGGVESASFRCLLLLVLINEDLAGERDFISTVHAYGASGDFL